MKTKNNKMIATAIAIILLVIAIIISLVFVFNKTETKSYDSKLEEAQSYVVKMDYKKAEAAYLAAIKVSPKKAKAYLEYGIICKTDLKLHYTLLADIYEENLQYKEIVSLISSAKTVNSALKTSLIKDLEERLKGTNYSADDEKTPLEDISLN